MSVKLLILCSALFAVQAQGFFIKTMGPLGDLQSQILQTKFNLISSASSTRYEFHQLLHKMFNEKQLAENSFNEKLLNLTSKVQILSQSKPIDMTCLTSFGLLRSDIQDKIEQFALANQNGEILAIRNDMGLLSKMISSPSKAMWTCRTQYPLMMIQMTELRECITSHLEITKNSAEELKLKVNSGMESLELTNKHLLENTTVGIDTMIENAESEFNACISIGPVV